MNRKLLSKECAMNAIRIFIDHDFSYVYRKDPVIHIVQNTEPDDRVAVVTETIQICLDSIQVNTKKQKFFQNSDTLVLALLLSRIVTIPRDTAESLVKLAAERGFHGCFPELPERLLGRSMNESDLSSLITAYVSDTSTRCEADEEKFELWAHTYLPTELAEKEIARIIIFGDAWDNQIDL